MFSLLELAMSLECIGLSLKMKMVLALFSTLQILEMFLQLVPCRLQDGLILKKVENIALLTS